MNGEGGMSDWQPGDLALCVRGGLWRGLNGKTINALESGGLYTVREVHLAGAPNTKLWPAGAIGLVLIGIDAGGPFSAARFHKIRPHTPDAEDAETIRLLTGKPVPGPAQ